MHAYRPPAPSSPAATATTGWRARRGVPRATGRGRTVIVAEAIGLRFERSKGGHVELRLYCVDTARRERHTHHGTRLFRSVFNRGAAAENNQVRQRNLLRARLLVEVLLDRFEFRNNLREFRRIIHRPVLLRSETEARAVCATAHIGVTEGHG